MMPTVIAGVMPWKGKKKPVTLVATVVPRNHAVQPLKRRPLIRPIRTTRPVRIPAKLITTCIFVNVICAVVALPQKSDPMLGPGQYRERFYERAVKKKVFSMPPTVLGS